MRRIEAAGMFLAGVALNLTATACMVAYSELVRRREADRAEMVRRLAG